VLSLKMAFIAKTGCWRLLIGKVVFRLNLHLYYYQYLAEHLLSSKALLASEQKVTCTVYWQLWGRLWHTSLLVQWTFPWIHPDCHCSSKWQGLLFLVIGLHCASFLHNNSDKQWTWPQIGIADG
jgi:hypothetical protein